MTRRLALLVNPSAGRATRRGAVSSAMVVDVLSRTFRVSTLQTSNADEAAMLARQAVEDCVDVLVVMGGDGAVHLALQAIAGTQVTLGVIPTGTGNDAARALGMAGSDPLAAAAVIASGVTRRIDLGRVASTYFATVLATGFDSRVSERADTAGRGNPMRYTAAALRELRSFTPLSYTLEIDGRRLAREAMLVAVGNGPSYGAGLRICEGAQLDDGLLDVVIIGPLSRRGLLAVYPRVFSGRHVDHPAYEHHSARTVRIDAADVVAYADGERLSALPVTVEVAPSSLSVFVPVP